MDILCRFTRISVNLQVTLAHVKTPSATNGVTLVVLAIEQENVMIRYGLIGATALSLAFAFVAPAMAGDVQRADVKHPKGQVRGVVVNPYVDPSLPIENALRWGYSQGYQYYPSGFGGLYGDGRYPGNTIENKNYPTWW
jgi:hypothetical protein